MAGKVFDLDGTLAPPGVQASSQSGLPQARSSPLQDPPPVGHGDVQQESGVSHQDQQALQLPDSPLQQMPEAPDWDGENPD